MAVTLKEVAFFIARLGERERTLFDKLSLRMSLDAQLDWAPLRGEKNPLWIFESVPSGPPITIKSNFSIGRYYRAFIGDLSNSCRNFIGRYSLKCIFI